MSQPSPCSYNAMRNFPNDMILFPNKRQYKLNPSYMSDKTLGWCIVIGLAFIGYLFFSIAEDKGPPQSSKPLIENRYSPDAMDAYIMAKQLIEKQLKAPATADFASFRNSRVTSQPGDEWTVESYVDSQNGFGALIRTRFTIKMMVNRDTKYWQAVSLETKP